MHASNCRVIIDNVFHTIPVVHCNNKQESNIKELNRVGKHSKNIVAAVMQFFPDKLYHTMVYNFYFVSCRRFADPLKSQRPVNAAQFFHRASRNWGKHNPATEQTETVLPSMDRIKSPGLTTLSF